MLIVNGGIFVKIEADEQVGEFILRECHYSNITQQKGTFVEGILLKSFQISDASG